MVRGGLSEEQAVQLQTACIQDLLHRDFGATREFWTRGEASHPLWDDAIRIGWTLGVQPSNDLGQNLIEAFSTAAGPTIVLGTDSPDLPSPILEQAFESLSNHDVVLGPSFDGGYYLLGLSEPAESLFHDVDWGSEKVFEQTVRHAFAAHMSLKVLPFWYDLDEVADLRRLRLHSTISGHHVPHRAKHVLDFLEANPGICIPSNS
jgi:rSAM/selenodomain-associated transferase 1